MPPIAAVGGGLDALHNGSADVLECGHIVVLGWSNKLLPMLIPCPYPLSSGANRH